MCVEETMRGEMTDLLATIGIRDDPGHWDASAERVAAKVARESHRGGFEWLASSRSTWVAACFLLIVALVSVLSSGEGPLAQRPGMELTKALAPVDDVGRAIILPDRPPPIGTLLLSDRGGT